MSGDLVAATGRGTNGDDVGVGGGNFGGKGAKLDTKIINSKGELVKGVVDVLKTGFDGIA